MTSLLSVQALLGISAGIYAVSRGKKTLVLEQAQVGGIIGKVSTVTQYTALQAQENRRNLRCSYEGAGSGCGREIAYETKYRRRATGVSRPCTPTREPIRHAGSFWQTAVHPSSWVFPEIELPARAWA